MTHQAAVQMEVMIRIAKAPRRPITLARIGKATSITLATSIEAHP